NGRSGPGPIGPTRRGADGSLRFGEPGNGDMSRPPDERTNDAIEPGGDPADRRDRGVHRGGDLEREPVRSGSHRPGPDGRRAARRAPRAEGDGPPAARDLSSPVVSLQFAAGPLAQW